MIPSDSNYIFGPVPSRRLGRSLGVDLVPFKTCSYDCIYCQLGRTTNKTVMREEWNPLEEIVDQVRRRLDILETPPDYITLSGSGEPTLFSRIDELIDRIKAFSSIPIAILTNGSLLWNREVRSQVSKADLIVPSLDAGNEILFRNIDRPHESISFHRILEGLIQMRKEYSKPYWLEVFLLAGRNDIQSEIEQIARCVKMIQPDRVQLNTVARPPAEEYAYSIPLKRLQAIAGEFGPNAEVITDYQGNTSFSETTDREADILSVLRRRPCTLEDISHSVNIHPNELVKSLEKLVLNRQISKQYAEGKSFFVGVATNINASNAGC